MFHCQLINRRTSSEFLRALSLLDLENPMALFVWFELRRKKINYLAFLMGMGRFPILHGFDNAEKVFRKFVINAEKKRGKISFFVEINKLRLIFCTYRQINPPKTLILPYWSKMCVTFHTWWTTKKKKGLQCERQSILMWEMKK